MKKCALCQNNDAGKTNTHYISDFIFRKNLNQNGSNDRETGLFWEMSTDKIQTEFKFQTATSANKIEDALGRVSTPEENAKAQKEKPYSVDYIFCQKCEDRFNVIETEFASKILPKLRGNKVIENSSNVSFKQIVLCRQFWFLQIWRTAICEDTYKMSHEVLEKLRNLILEGLSAKVEDVYIYPIKLSFLVTAGKASNSTSNATAVFPDKNPYVLWLNDFVVQFFESEDKINFDLLYGVNDLDSFHTDINFQETDFKIQVITDGRRKEIINQLFFETKVKPSIAGLQNYFIAAWYENFRSYPTPEIVAKYLKDITNWDHLPEAEKMSAHRIAKFTADFIKEYY